MRIIKRWAVLVAAVGAVVFPTTAEARYAVSTGYCLSGTMADGTGVRSRSIAMNIHPLGTIIKTRRPGPDGRRVYHVRDRIGHGTQLDFWVPSCSTALRWGRRGVNYYVMRYGYHWRNR